MLIKSFLLALCFLLSVSHAQAGWWTGGILRGIGQQNFDPCFARPEWSSLEKIAEQNALEKCSKNFVKRLSEYHHQILDSDETCTAKAWADYGCGEYISDF